MKKTTRFINALLINSGYAYCAFEGFYHSVAPARNIFMFTCWVQCILYLVVALEPDRSGRKTMRAKGPAWPRWMSRTLDLALTIFLTAMGHFVLASVVLLGAIFEASIFDSEN